jgi:hypothetical protein
MEVHALSRSRTSDFARTGGGRIHSVVADATDPEEPVRFLRETQAMHRRAHAGATPRAAAIQEHT